MKTLALTTCALLLPLSASAQQAQTNRFQLQRTETGIVRLDTETGAMTLCRDENGTLACRMQPDERAAYEQELDRLAKRVTALEERLSNIPPVALPKALPSDAEVDRSLSIMEKFMRRFMAIVGEFADEREADKPQPNRT
ncbi:hypothetical protein NOJ28_15690 [Neorhizobium galegae]|uniref:hypothetical protein n=1 Tax=Neorhizobium galegae TaxID=399 RepID=UPI002105BF65|nr:hypothetical protein [Neorhizobium galegae]MCQ1766980.1 hypothetical protein [Neorhizobium galegae]MCQ1849053.1 hypothetical protein [Neorhizobium galegae]